MPEQMELKPGDYVIYRDRDQIRWGPWEVAEVRGESVTMLVENLVRCSAKIHLLERVVAPAAAMV